MLNCLRIPDNRDDDLVKQKFDPRCHIGETHGVFTIIDVLDEKNQYGQYVYKGICNECGYVKISTYGHFSGKGEIATICKHVSLGGGYVQQIAWENPRISRIFKGMKRRCYSSNCRDYRWYGAKGIRICDDWLQHPKSFEKWAMNNGYRDDLTIDRIDENENYSPENCRWISIEDNARYKSTTELIEVNNQTHTGREWSRVLGIGTNVINTYIRKYGLDNTKEFIAKYMANPGLKPKVTQSFYNLYMSDDNQLTAD